MSTCKTWEDMDTDVLVKIFRELNLLELAPVSQVCRQWRFACSDPLLWRSLDLGLLRSNYIQTRASPYVWVDDRSDRKLTRVLRMAMGLSGGNITCMIFHFNLYMKDEHLNFISERTPHLKRLVLPAWNRITKVAICEAVRRWEGLESLTMPSIAHPPYIMEEISRSCKNFTELKIMDAFNMQFAKSIVANVPNLKVLSLRCSKMSKEALMFILDSMNNLEVLNISHCILVEGPSAKAAKRAVLDRSILEKASRLREFYHCQSRQCTTCQRMIADDGLIRWWKYEGPFWRHDEVSSLGLGDYGRLFDERCFTIGGFQI